MDPDTERQLLDAIQDLYLWSLNLCLTPEKSRERVQQLGVQMFETFIGSQGENILTDIDATAILIDVDETILNLPWELIGKPNGAISQETNFGRLVTTRVTPRKGRDPLEEDAVVRILAVANPTVDLPVCEAEIEKLANLAGDYGAFRVEVEALKGDQATRARFKELLAAGDYDMLHFAGHAYLDPSQPESSALLFADGALAADEVLSLPWESPPYLVFNSACGSGRAVGGKRLVSNEDHSNGLAAAFLASSVTAYAGYFWPVTEVDANLFAETFYRSLFMRENVGLAFLDARNHAILELGDIGDLTGYSAVLFGDAASQHRRDLAMAA